VSKQIFGAVAGRALTDGSPQVVPLSGAVLPLTVWVNPVAGDTVTVEYQPGVNGPWLAWPNGAATAFSSAVLDAPVEALRFTRSAGAGITSTFGVR
jgi:hypothetical protein